MASGLERRRSQTLLGSPGREEDKALVLPMVQGAEFLQTTCRNKESVAHPNAAFCQMLGRHHLPSVSVNLFCYLKANEKNKTKPRKPSCGRTSFRNVSKLTHFLSTFHLPLAAAVGLKDPL